MALLPALSAAVLLVASNLFAALPNPVELPTQPALPDPLVMLDGRKVTSEMWLSERRPELLRLFQHYMYGSLPPKPAVISFKLERVDAAAFGGKATLAGLCICAARTDPKARTQYSA